MTISAQPLEFGDYSSGSARTVTTTITVTVTAGTPWTVGIGSGLYSDAGGRRLAHSLGGNQYLSYGLFKDAAHTTNWGAGANGVSGTGTGSPQVLTVYGRIPALQFWAPGSYSDALTVSATIPSGGSQTPLIASATIPPDVDEDGVPDGIDNCPSTANADQRDHDHDDVGDACDTSTDLDRDGVCDPGFTCTAAPVSNDPDNCPRTPNPAQDDHDADGLGDECDDTPASVGGNADADADGVPNLTDNCIDVANPAQTDSDDDTIGDPCDTEPETTVFTDYDQDGDANDADNCMLMANSDQADEDNDGRGNVCDVCPAGPNNVDTDDDGLADACDACPEDATNSCNAPQTCMGEEATIEAQPGVPVTGTNGDDVIVGTDGEDEIDAGKGEDLVCALGGEDDVQGSNGRDELHGGDDADTLRGREGADTLRGEAGDDELRGGKAADDLDGGGDEDSCQGGNGEDAAAACEQLKGIP